MAGTIETTPDSPPAFDTTVTAEPSGTRVIRRIAIWALAAAAVAGVCALTVAVVRDTDDSAPSHFGPPAAATTETKVRPDPLISRFGRNGDQTPVHDPLITRFRK
jgi:hypothetical protein